MEQDLQAGYEQDLQDFQDFQDFQDCQQDFRDEGVAVGAQGALDIHEQGS